MYQPYLSRVLIAALLMALLSGCTQVAYVDELKIENPTDYDLVVEVHGNGSPASLGLGIAPKKRTSALQEVLDFGSRWTFRFTYQGQTVGNLSVDRKQLESSGWTLVIPSELGTRLKESGVPESY